MSKDNFELRPFGGLHTSISPESLNPLYAQDCLNVLTADGALKPRYGYRAIGSIPSGFSACYGFGYAQGYNSSRAEVERFLAVHTRSGNTRPYEIDVATGAVTEIRSATPASVSLGANAGWQMFGHDQYGYFVNGDASTSVWRYTLGTPDSISSLSSPSAPATAPVFAITYGNAANPYAEKVWTGATVGGSGSPYSSNTIQADGTVRVTNAASTTGDVAITIDLGAGGVQDYTYNDIFALRLSYDHTGGYALTPKTITFINNDGSPITLSPDVLRWTEESPGVYPPSRTMCARVEFIKKTRADWDNVRKVVINYSVTQALSSTVYVYISQMVVGGMTAIDFKSQIGRDPSPPARFACAYYNASLVPGGLSPLSPFVEVDTRDTLRGYSVWKAGPLGVRFTLVAPTTADGAVTKCYFYAYTNLTGTLRWYELGSTTLPSYTYTIDKNKQDLVAGTMTEHAPGNVLANVVAAIPFKGWFVWLTKGGTQNVRHSALPGSDGVPRPTKLYSTTDPFDDPTRGADFSLADNFADQPLCGFDADDSLIILGNYGCYAQTSTTGLFADELGYQSVGWTPSTMSASRKLPGSHGCAGRFAACRWKGPGNEPGVAYMDADGNIWFAAVAKGFDGEQGYLLAELSSEIRGYSKTFLLDGQSLTSYSDVKMQADEYNESLWVILGTRALVLRRPSQIDGQRHWEPYDYNLGGAYTIQYTGFSGKRWLKAMLSTGQMVEFERNWATKAVIESTLRDGGYAMTTPYWTSKTFFGDPRRLMCTNLYRSVTTDTPTLTWYSERNPNGTSKQMVSGEIRSRWHFDNAGRWHKVKISFPTTVTGRVTNLLAEFLPCAGRTGAGQ